MTQNFHVMEQQSGHKGAYIKLTDTIEDVAAIIMGAYDTIKPEKLLNIGILSELKDK